MRVLVTGAGGFVGSHLAAKLCAAGDDVRVLVRSSSLPPLLRDAGAEVVGGDLADEHARRNAVRGCERVFHVGALTTDARANRDDYVAVNATASAELARAARAAGAPRFVYVSSISVHEPSATERFDETTPIHPERDDDYAFSKAEAEKALSLLSAPESFDVVIVRPGRVYGPGDRNLLPVFRLIASGWCPRLAGVSAIQQPIYVDDFVSALERIGDRGSGIYSIVGAEEIQVDDLFDRIAAVLGARRLPVPLPIAPAIVASSLVEKVCLAIGRTPPISPRRFRFFRNTRRIDAMKIRRELGWSPAIGLDEGLRRTADSYRANQWL